MIAVPVDGSVLIEPIGPVAVVPESEPPHLDSFATQGGSMDLAQTDHPLVASPGVLVEPSVAAGQDELTPSSGHATQGGSVELDVQINNYPVAPPGMSAEPLVETKRHGPAVEAGPMDEPNLGEHATQVQHSELLAQADILLDGLGDAQRRVDETLRKPGPSRAYPVASFGRRTS